MVQSLILTKQNNQLEKGSEHTPRSKPFSFVSQTRDAFLLSLSLQTTYRNKRLVSRLVHFGYPIQSTFLAPSHTPYPLSELCSIDGQ